jgi:hypothetical protein
MDADVAQDAATVLAIGHRFETARPGPRRGSLELRLSAVGRIGGIAGVTANEIPAIASYDIW